MITEDVEGSNLSVMQRYTGKTIKKVAAQHKEVDTIVNPSIYIYFTDGSRLRISTSEWMDFE